MVNWQRGDRRGGRGGSRRNSPAFGLAYPVCRGGCGGNPLHGPVSLLYAALRTSPGVAPFRDNRDSSVAIPVNIGGLALSIPRRYIEPGVGGKNMAALVAALPEMRGFSQKDAPLFADNAPDSPVLHLLIRAEPAGLAGKERLQRLYMPYIANP